MAHGAPYAMVPGVPPAVSVYHPHTTVPPQPQAAAHAHPHAQSPQRPPDSAAWAEAVLQREGLPVPAQQQPPAASTTAWDAPGNLGTEYMDRRLRELWAAQPPPQPAAADGRAGHPAPPQHPAAAPHATLQPPPPQQTHPDAAEVPPLPAPPLREHNRVAGRLPGPRYPKVPEGGKVAEQPFGDGDERMLLIVATISGRSLVCAYNGVHDRVLIVSLQEEDTAGNVRRRGSAELTQNRDGQHVLAVAVLPGETEELADGWFTAPLRPRWSVTPLTAEHTQRELRERRQIVRREHNGLAEGLVNELQQPHPEAAVLRTAAERRVPFVDLWFPPQRSSIDGRQDGDAPGAACWGRPASFLSGGDGAQPALFATPPAPNDVERGPLGDAMLLSCVAALCEHPSRRQPADPLRHCFAAHTQQHSDVGACVVQLVRGGWWRDIVIDDYLPLAPLTPGSAVLAPAGIRSILLPSEVWPCLLEKAYAKAAGSYADLAGMQPHEILCELTGYPAAPLRWGQGPALFADVIEWHSRGFPIVLCAPGTPRGLDEPRSAADEQYESQGLLAGHCYAVLRILNPRGHGLLQLRNPWATGWRGKYALPNGPGWTPELRRLCGTASAVDGPPRDGTFYVSWEEARRWFLGGAVLYTMPEAGELRASLQVLPQPGWVIELAISQPMRVYIAVHPRAARGGVAEQPPPHLTCTLLLEQGSPGEYARVDDTQQEGCLLAVHELEASPKPALLYVHAPQPDGPRAAPESDVVVTLHYVAIDQSGGAGRPRGTATFRSATPVAAAVAQSRPGAPALWLPAAYGLTATETVVQHRRSCSEPTNPTQPMRVSHVPL